MPIPGKFDATWMDLADSLSRHSTCKRLNVGCAIVSCDDQRVLAIGYNGSWKGGPNACDSDEPGNCGCFPPNVKVQMSDGIKRIQDINEGDFVLTHLNRYRRVSKVLRKGAEQRSYVVMKIHGGQRFTSTIDHPVRVKMLDGSFGWKKAQDLIAGDVILFKTRNCDTCGRDIPALRKMCYRCFADSSKGKEFRERASQRMKEANPMKKLYSKPKELILDDAKVKNHIVTGKQIGRAHV